VFAATDVFFSVWESRPRIRSCPLISALLSVAYERERHPMLGTPAPQWVEKEFSDETERLIDHAV
jgi:hypothetical protein